MTNNVVNISVLWSYDFFCIDFESEIKSMNILRPLIRNIKLFLKKVMLIFFPINNISVELSPDVRITIKKGKKQTNPKQQQIKDTSLIP